MIPRSRLQVFDEQPHWQLMKEMLTHVFATPKGHQKSKPFTDHVINFAVADERIWIRNYQVHFQNLSSEDGKNTDMYMYVWVCVFMVIFFSFKLS